MEQWRKIDTVTYLKVKEKIENWTMRSVTVVTVLTFLAITTNAIPVANRLRFAKERAIGDPCGSGGTCKDESECGSEMKIAKSGLCPHDPANIKCCLTPNTCTLSSGQSGVCIERSHCTASGKTPESKKCPLDGATILCCPDSSTPSVPDSSTTPTYGSSTPSAPVPSGDCGPYTGATVPIEGNNEVVYDCHKISIEHWAGSQSSLNLPPEKKDNSMEKETACAFSRMHDAAKASGVELKITSGFRVLARQEYFWNCYQTKSCNNGNLAARPGTSNHGTGKALDIANAGGKNSNADGNFCKNASPQVYAWLQQHAPEYGFVRTVKKECWHWEYRPNEASSPPAYQ